MIFTLGCIFINFEHHFNACVFFNQSAMDSLVKHFVFDTIINVLSKYKCLINEFLI